MAEKDWGGNKRTTYAQLGASNQDFVPVKGYEDRLCISKEGKVLSLKTNKILKTTIFPNGYEVLCLMYQKPKRHTKTLYIHRLVAQTFIDNPHNKKTVNHKDGNKTNNNVNNLEWATQGENNKHAYNNNLRIPHCEGFVEYNNKKRVLSEYDVEYIQTHQELNIEELSKILNNNHKGAIYNCKNGKTWKKDTKDKQY